MHLIAESVTLNVIRSKLTKRGILDAMENGFWTNRTRHLGTRTHTFLHELVKKLSDVKSKDQPIKVLEELFERIKNHEISKRSI